MDGFVLIDKEKDWTSFDVVAKARGILKVKKVGHSGTLDKAATGLLILGLGKGTKKLGEMLKMDKVYEFTAKFGSVSDTFDSEGEISVVDEEKVVLREEIEKVIAEKYMGEISQVPPRYSALKVGGRRASDIVRGGGDVELKARDLTIYKYEVVGYQWPLVKFCVECSSGTYVRSLVSDLGQDFGCGAYVVELRRISIGDYSVADAVKVGELDKKVEQVFVGL